ncbi:MAG: N-acetylmuramoyl-L-alanine amidase [Gemmatimonadaceae bacterium]
MLRLRVLPLLALAAACAPASRVPVPGPMPGRPPAPVNPSLPPIPLVTGPMEIKVVYPTPNSVVASRDSNFIFGSIGNGNAALFINGEPVPVWPNGAYLAFLPVPSRDMSRYDIVAVLGRDTSRLSHPIRLLPPPDTTTPVTPAQPQPVDTAVRYGILVGPTTVSNDTDRVVTGQPSPDPNIVRYFLFPGTVVRTQGTVGNETVVELESSVRFRVANSQIQEQPAGYEPPQAIGRDTIIPYAESVDLIVPALAPPAYYVRVDSSRLTVTLFGVTPFAPRTEGSRVIQDPLLRSISIAHGQGRTEYILDLSGPVFAYQPLFENGNFVLKVRRPPVIDPSAPLRGLRIAIDPGHPGLEGQAGGATGPTGLPEREAVVPVALRARDLLIERGAEVLLTKTEPEQAVDLNLRPTMARRANVHALVSIHYNAFPDGVNPFVNNGTSTYSFHAHSARLSQLVHEAMIRNMHLGDLGTRRANFAVVRPTWFPAVLTEAAFMMLPDQEHAMKTAEYQDAHARSIVEGLEQFFRELGASQSATVLPSKSSEPPPAVVAPPRADDGAGSRRSKICNALKDLVLRRRAGVSDAEQAGQCGEVSLHR